MKTTGKSAGGPIEARSRLWMLAVVGMLFSFAWPVVDALTHQYTFVRHSAQISLTTRPLISGDVLSRNVLRMMPITTRTLHHARSSLAVPVGFHVADLNMPRNADRVFSYRKVDEFLQHQVRLSDGARNSDRQSAYAGQRLRAADINEQVDDVQIF